MHRLQRWLKFSIASLMFAVVASAQKDPARRRPAIDEIFTEDCVFYEPSGRVYRGRDEIDRVAATLRAMHPDFRYQPIAEPEESGKKNSAKRRG